MNEVEKMYRNAHVYPRVYGDITKETFENKVFNMADMCNEAFTAEKQLLLIQWLAETRPIHINLSFDKWTIEGMVRYGIKYDTFKDALSGYINQIWQGLTEEEKQQVKGILE